MYEPETGVRRGRSGLRAGPRAVAGQRGITGLETAIILIAFVVVASVFAFTVLSTGIFSSEQAKEAVHAGLGEARSSLEPRGSLTAFTGKLSDSTQTVYKTSFVVTSAVTDEPVDLTPPYTSDGSGTDPDLSSGAEYSLVVSYSDDSQRLSDLPWTVNWVGFSNGDNILDPGEKAEITAWLMDRDTGTSIDTDGSISLMDGTGDGGGTGGIASTSSALGTNDEFTLEVQPESGAVIRMERRVPPRLDTVMDLK